MSSSTKTAVLSGGCFWGMEELFRKQKGIVGIVVGYARGENQHPNGHRQGDAEALKITYDSSITSYPELLDFFFRIHDPTTLNRQGNDVGTSYRSAIFYEDEEQKKEAERFIDIVNKSGRWPNPVVTMIEPLEGFMVAEAYHQDYLQNNPGGYTCHFVRSMDSYLPKK